MHLLLGGGYCRGGSRHDAGTPLRSFTVYPLAMAYTAMEYATTGGPHSLVHNEKT